MSDREELGSDATSAAALVRGACSPDEAVVVSVTDDAGAVEVGMYSASAVLLGASAGSSRTGGADGSAGSGRESCSSTGAGGSPIAGSTNCSPGKMRFGSSIASGFASMTTWRYSRVSRGDASPSIVSSIRSSERSHNVSPGAIVTVDEGT